MMQYKMEGVLYRIILVLLHTEQGVYFNMSANDWQDKWQIGGEDMAIKTEA